MPSADDLLIPIDGPNPSGADLRYTLYDAVKEARREEAVPPPGMTEQDRKVADNPLVIKLATEALAKKTKDLWLAAWLTEAWVKQSGFTALKEGLTLCHGLVEKFWDTLYPEIEDGDMEVRAAPLEFLGTRLEIPLKSVRLVAKEPYGFTDVQEARKLGHESDAKTDEAKKARDTAIKQGRIALESIDKCFEETPKAFYANGEKDLDACIKLVTQLKASCDAKFGDMSPSFGKLESVLGDIRPVMHGFLQKKREKEPDPVEAPPPPEAGAESATEAVPGSAGESAVAGPVRAGVVFSIETSSEPPDRLEAVRKIAEAAAFLRRREPRSPASYLMLRGLRWGELRAAIDRSDPTQLEAPPTELRTHLKRLALDKKWADLLDAAENAMALPCSRAWLDLQRMVVEACEALGSDYEAIARAIRAELKALITDIPQLLDVTLMDDTAAANADTRAWLKSLAPESPPPPASAEPSGGAGGAVDGPVFRWPSQPADLYVAAQQALREGQERKAFDILNKDIARQRSGRERFRRRVQMVEMCVSTNRLNIAQLVLDDLAAAIETHKLDDWEDPTLVANTLTIIMKLSQRLQSDAGQRQKLFERICRLDPAQALGDGK
ncbi:MAG: type VI secretion system protein TssA [Terriglobia bacterium]|jgi:type VI secretion system protein ImpA